MKIMFVNNAGGGFAQEVEVKAKTKVSDFFKEMMKNSNPDSFIIRVNRQVITAKEILTAGDRVTITPVKIDGGG